MAGFNLARKSKDSSELLRNVNALNQRANIPDGNNKQSEEGFDIIGTEGKVYDLDAIKNGKDRNATSSLVIENKEMVNESNEGNLIISTDNSKKVIPIEEDYIKYLLDD